jgi:autotransporter-associated beta strand protein
MVVNNSTGNYSISGTGTIGGTGSLTKSGTGTLTLATANSYSGGTNVSAGLLMVEPTSSTTSALPKGSLSITGGEVQLATNVTQGSQSANVPITAPTSNVNITSLSISGSGKLDIVNNHIIIDYGTNADPIASIAALIADGAYGSGTTVTWTGTGITSSAAALIPTSYGIGYADALDPGNPAGLASGTIEVMYTLLGDANLDGKVNGSDFNLMATNFNQAVTAGWDKGDFNYDGKVNGNDFVLLAANFNQFASQSAVSSTADQAALDAFAAANGISLTSVPEPASTGLLALGVVSVMARRRRKAKA